jgi:ABC-type Fe3+ transport system substrate-binding protein
MIQINHEHPTHASGSSLRQFRSNIWRTPVTRRDIICGLAFAVTILAFPAIGHSADWEVDWKRTLSQAKVEGRLEMSIPSGSVWRAELLRFQDAYPDIKLNMTAFSGRDFWARFLKERELGQYLWDIRIGGYDAQEYQIKQAGNMQSVRDLLLLPEIVDESKWYGGLDGPFLDREKNYIFGFVNVAQTTARFNVKFIGPALNAADLVDPKWSGKISMADPRGGSSLNGMGGLYKKFGPDFIRKLLIDQKPVITNIPRQQMDWLVSGRYPIAFGLPSAVIVEYGRNGGDTSALSDLKGARQSTSGVGAITVPTKNPHPAATKVFVNWLLSRDVQEHLMKAVQLNSQRNDVAQGASDSALDYAHIDDYFRGQAEDVKPYLDEVKKIMATAQ